MTITGIDSTGQPAGGNARPTSGVTDADDLEAQLVALEVDAATAPISALPEAAPEPEVEQRRRFWPSLTWRDVLALSSFIVVALFITAPLWLNLNHELRDDPQD